MLKELYTHQSEWNKVIKFAFLPPKDYPLCQKIILKVVLKLRGMTKNFLTMEQLTNSLN